MNEEQPHSQASPEEAILAECERLRDGNTGLVLATLNVQLEPEASYTPYLFHDGCFYIFVSGLSAHTANLLANGKASVLFLENEQETRNPFARKRLSYRCQARVVIQDDARRESLLDLFRQRQGPTLDLLRQLPDFILFELKPIQGNFVKGFGQAFVLEGEGLRQVRQQTGK